MSRTVRGIAQDQRIFGALAGGPLSANEIADRLRLEVWEAWAERHGLEIEWGDPNEPVGARVLAYSEADEMGPPYLFSHQVYPRLRGLERRGEVERIQIEGHRPILWRAGGSYTCPECDADVSYAGACPDTCSRCGATLAVSGQETT